MAGFGAALTMRSLLEFLFTTKPAYFTDTLQIAMKLGLGARATPDQLLSLAVGAAVVMGVHVLLTRTAMGRAMRAVSENPQLASIAGDRCAPRHPLRLASGCSARLPCGRDGGPHRADQAAHGP